MALLALLTGWPALAIAGLYIALVVAKWLRYPQAPGPFLARFTNLWYGYRMVLGHFEKDNIELHRRYGKIVRVGPNLYSIDDAAASKTIYGHGTHFIKGEWYKGWGVPKSILSTNLFALLDAKQHANVRRQYANVYSMSSLVGYEPYVDNCVDILCRRLVARSSQSETIDLTKWFQWYAFDVIGEITFSRRFGFMELEKDVDSIIDLIGNITETNSITGPFPILVALQSFLASNIPLGGAGKFVKYATDQVKEAKKALLHGYNQSDPEERTGGAPDFVSKLTAQVQSGSEKLKLANVDPDLLVQGGALQNMFAGSDTTSISLNATLFNIIAHPDVLGKLREELDGAAARGELSDPPTFAEAQALPYLQAVMKEALRIHPATGLPLWREVPAGGATLCGTYFPAGTNVGINSWVAHRSQEIWGPDADKFRPERWLESSEEKLRELNAVYMPFGLGSRTCIGKNISLLEISKVIPQLVRKFDIFLAGTGTAAKISELPAKGSWFVKQQEFMVQVKPRES